MTGIHVDSIAGYRPPSFPETVVYPLPSQSSLFLLSDVSFIATRASLDLSSRMVSNL